MNDADKKQPQRLRDRAMVAMVVLGLVLLADINAILADLDQLSLIDRVMSGERVSGAEAKAGDDRFATAGVIQIVMTLIAAIAFLLWFSRAYRNTVRMGYRPRYRHGWAIGSWFIPIVNLILPKQIADDIWRGSDPDDTNPATKATGTGPVSPLLHFWWGAWIVGGLLGNFLIRSAFGEAATAEGVRSLFQAYLVTDLIDVVALVLAIFVIRETTSRLEARRARFESGTLAAPGWPPPVPEHDNGAQPAGAPQPASLPQPGVASTSVPPPPLRS